MLTPNVAGFFRKARADSGLAEQVRNTGSYQALAELSERAGDPVPAGELRAAFTARNAGVLARHMMRRGALDASPLPPVPPMDRDVWSRVASMDLSPVVLQLVNYQGWTEDRARAAEHRYRRFFYLKATMPEGKASPTPEVDEFWHQHIINTERYGPDCQRVAGRFFHHTFLSPDDPADARELSDVWLSTWVRYEALFEEPYEETVGAALLERWPNV